MFPTSVRNTALGFCSLFSRFGGVLAPLLTNSNLPGIYTIFGLTGVFSGLAGFFLPETKGKTLPESIIEAEKSDDGYEMSALLQKISSCFSRNRIKPDLQLNTMH